MDGIFGRLAARSATNETKSIEFDQTMQAFFGLLASKTGISVTTETALKVTTVLACARVIAQGFAQAPVGVYRVAEDGSKKPLPAHPVHKLLTRRPNKWQTAYEFREGLALRACLQGNGYAWIGEAGGQIKELLPLINVGVRQSANWELGYDVADANGIIATLPKSQVLHLRGPSWNGFLGLDVMTLCREAIGLSIATEENHARLFANGAKPGGIISFTNPLGGESYDRLKQQLLEQNEGLANAYKTLVLDNGADFKPFAMTGVDSQHLETRRYQIEEVCRGLGVFPQMVGHTDKTATFASAEAFFNAHETHTLGPWFTRAESVYERDLLANDDDLVVRHTSSRLRHGNSKDLAEYFKSALGAGGSPAWMTQDEVRSASDLNPFGGAASKLPVATNVPKPPPTPPAEDA